MLNRRSIVLSLLAAGACNDAASPSARELRVDVLARGLNAPWSLAFVSPQDILITEKFAGVRRFAGGALTAVPGGPANILAQGDSGLLDVALDPQFATNRFVYLSFTEGDVARNRMAIFRGRYGDGAIEDGQVIFRVGIDKEGDGHSGGRMLFLPDETLLITSGEGRTLPQEAQNLGSHLGKTLRLTRDGAPAPDNPFIGREGALPEIYTYGHRNVLGMVLDPRDNSVWQAEMGPRGGDEINRIVAGGNYGWPIATFGTDYDGRMISPDQEAPGVESPVVVFSPSISPSGLAVYAGDAFPDWQGDFLTGSLSAQHLRRVRIRDSMAVLEEVLLRDRQARIRDVRVGPDGLIYALTDSDDGELLRLQPA
ncbi:MAG: PQQ-dependent sugar dehydrogenase [Hyphomonadaceae bacterium]